MAATLGLRVKTKEEADAIAKQLAEGADFVTLAAEKSTDNSGPNKGDLGWFAYRKDDDA